MSSKCFCSYLPLKKAKYTMGVKALTNFKMKVLKIRRSSKLLSVFGTSETEAMQPCVSLYDDLIQQHRQYKPPID